MRKRLAKKGTMDFRDKRVFYLNFHKVEDKILMLYDKLNLLQVYSMTDYAHCHSNDNENNLNSLNGIKD